MIELLQKYSLEEIIIFVVLLALAIKGALSFFDWLSIRLDSKYKRKFEKEEQTKMINEQIEEILKNQKDFEEALLKIEKTINLLVDSDKDDIKAWITEKHHFFCYKQGFIDDFNLECIEKRYTHYTDEGGNSFVGKLMNEIRALPRVSNIEKEENK